jgi:hypothetical protein
MIRYFFAAAASAVVLPAVEKIGVGWFSTITAVFLVLSTVSVHCTVLWGKSWRDKIDGRTLHPPEDVPEPRPVQPATHNHDEKQLA